MTPQELYRAVNAYDASIGTSKVCELHKPCLRTPKCGTKQRSQLIDFDRVKETYCKNNKLPALSSVDGLAVTDKNKIFFFVEIKSWENVITHPVTGKQANPNVIEKTARVYAQELAKKLNESQKNMLRHNEGGRLVYSRRQTCIDICNRHRGKNESDSRTG